MGTRKDKDGKTVDKEDSCRDCGKTVQDMDSGLQAKFMICGNCQKVPADMFEFLEKMQVPIGIVSCNKTYRRRFRHLLRCKRDRTSWKVGRTKLKRRSQGS